MNDKFSQQERYDKQIKVRYIGEKGQAELKNSKCAIIGLGALGSIIAEHLTRAGVGTIKLIDRDFVEYSNLQRQTLYTEEDAKLFLPKATAAYQRLTQINSQIDLLPIISHLDAANIDHILSDVDIVLDATDNLETRYLLNEYSISQGLPWIYGAAVGTHGSTANFIPDATPCFQCLFPSLASSNQVETCDTVGVLSPIISIVGSMQATEAIKFMSGNREAMHNKLVQMDCWQPMMMPLHIESARNAHCPICNEHQYVYLNQAQDVQLQSILCGRNAVHIESHTIKQLDLLELKGRLEQHYEIKINPYLLKIQINEDMTMMLFEDGRAIVKGTQDIEYAKALLFKILN